MANDAFEAGRAYISPPLPLAPRPFRTLTKPPRLGAVDGRADALGLAAPAELFHAAGYRTSQSVGVSRDALFMKAQFENAT